MKRRPCVYDTSKKASTLCAPTVAAINARTSGVIESRVPEKQPQTKYQALQQVEPRFRDARGYRNVGPAMTKVIRQASGEPERI